MFDYAKQKPLHKYTAQFAGARGSIESYKDGIVMHTGERKVAVRSNYVQSLSQNSTEPFSKIGAEMTYYDMFGNLEKISFQMRETDFKSLKMDLGK